MERAFHEVANIFPLMSGEEFDALVADIDQNGLIEPIWLHPEDYSIIDGRNRYLACRRLGFEPEFRTWNGIGSLTEFVLSLNLHRRHLTDEQRVAIAVGVLPMLEAEAALNVGGRPRKLGEKIPQVNKRDPKSTERAADMMNTNHRYVSDAKRISEQAPEVFELMKQAKINMPAAKQLAAMDSAKRIAVLDEMNANGVDRITGREMKTSQLLAQPWPNKPHVSNNSGNNEWYTPAHIIDAARAVMGSIDLDPASSDVANQTVRAAHYFTIEDDGLSHEWHGNVWMNPPYSSNLIGAFCDKLVGEFDNGNVKAAMVLVNNATETEWFKILVKKSSAVCFLSSRVKFWKPDGEIGAPLQGQALLYFGQNKEGFAAACKSLGWIAWI